MEHLHFYLLKHCKTGDTPWEGSRPLSLRMQLTSSAVGNHVLGAFHFSRGKDRPDAVGVILSSHAYP